MVSNGRVHDLRRCEGVAASAGSCQHTDSALTASGGVMIDRPCL